MSLWHYTCSHGRAGIGKLGLLHPPERLQVSHQELLPPHMRWLSRTVWATDMDHPDAAALGLTSFTLGCDRAAFRYRLTAHASVIPWLSWCRYLPAEAVFELESAPGAQPDRWWVGSGHSVPVRLDQLVRAS